MLPAAIRIHKIIETNFQEETMKKSIIITLATLSLFAFSFAQTAFSADTLVIGHPACLSGKYAKAGEQAVNGIKAVVKWVNESYGGVKVGNKTMKLEYKYYDSESQKEQVGSLIERLITSDNVNVVFSAYSSGLTMAGAPVAEKYKMVYMDHGGASDNIFAQGWRYIVQTIGPARKYHEGTLNYVRHHDKNVKRLALVYEDSEFARMVQKGTQEYAEKLGFEIVFNRTYPQNPADLTPLLSSLKVRRPEIILGGGHYVDGQLLCRQMADLDINAKAISLLASVTLEKYYEAVGGGLAEGMMGPSHWEYGVTFSQEKADAAGMLWIGPSQDEFVSLFKEAIGEDTLPDYHAAEAGAQVLAYVLAVVKSQSIDQDTIRKTLGDLQFMSFYGGWDIDAETGMQIGHSMVDIQWQKGSRKIVWPLDAATADAIYPKPRF